MSDGALARHTKREKRSRVCPSVAQRSTHGESHEQLTEIIVVVFVKTKDQQNDIKMLLLLL